MAKSEKESAFISLSLALEEIVMETNYTVKRRPEDTKIMVYDKSGICKKIFVVYTYGGRRCLSRESVVALVDGFKKATGVN